MIVTVDLLKCVTRKALRKRNYIILDKFGVLNTKMVLKIENYLWFFQFTKRFS